MARRSLNRCAKVGRLLQFERVDAATGAMKSLQFDDGEARRPEGMGSSLCLLRQRIHENATKGGRAGGCVCGPFPASTAASV